MSQLCRLSITLPNKTAKEYVKLVQIRQFDLDTKDQINMCLKQFKYVI